MRYIPPHGARTGRSCRLAALGLALLLTVSIFTILPSGAEAVRRVPYQFAFSILADGGGTDVRTQVVVTNGMHVDVGHQMTFAGWCCTDQGIDHYEFAWVAASGGPTRWERPDTENITPAPYLADAGIPFPSGYASAGFEITFAFPKDTPDGYYDLYFRAVTDDNVACDLAILLNVSYGLPDADASATRTVNVDRLARDVKQHVGVTASMDKGLVMRPDGRILLGDLPLAAFESVTVTYRTPEGFVPETDGHRAILGLKAGDSPLYEKNAVPPYRMSDGRYDMTGSLTYTALPSSEGIMSVTMDLTGAAYDGPVWLTSYMPEGNRTGLTVTSVVFNYKDRAFTRSAAKIRFSGDLAPYFYSPNRTSVSTVHDPVMGDVMRLEVVENTNDAFVHFAAESLLNDYGIRLSADDYKYMVVLYRASAANLSPHMNFYLCAGGIGGPTEACNRGAVAEVDGKWHYLLLDLQDPAWGGTPNWQGALHLWRFDMIGGTAVPGNYVDYASVQFFRSREAAEKACRQSVTNVKDPFVAGDPENHPAVIDDQSEEEGLRGDSVDWVIPEEDIYCETLPETEPVTEPVTQPVTEPATSPDTGNGTSEEESGTQKPTEGKGCRSALPFAFLMILPALPLLLRRRRRHDTP